MAVARRASEAPGTIGFKNTAAIRASLACALGVLLAVTVWAAARRHDELPIGVVLVAFPFAVVAAAGLARPFPVRATYRYGWLAALTLLWIALAAQEATASYVAVVLFVLYFLLLPGPWGAVATGLVTALSVMLSTAGAGPSTGAILGPILSGVAAIAISAAVHSLSAVSESRRELIDELVRTRGLLAESERQAGIITERERLAHEIHDTVAQGLSSIQLLLHAAERDTPETSPALERMALARTTAAQSLRETRAIIAALQPDDLAESSFPDALRRLADSAMDSELEISVAVEGGEGMIDLPMKLEAGLLRISQSAIANVRQHSGATRARITLTIEQYSVRLDIVDDGAGFNVQDMEQNIAERAEVGHIGMAAMRHRARSMGGTLEVESTPGSGTAVVVSVPREELHVYGERGARG